MEEDEDKVAVMLPQMEEQNILLWYFNMSFLKSRTVPSF